jgi:hypothetical protein
MIFLPGLQRTGWKIVSSSGGNASILFFGGGLTNIYMKHDTEPKETYRFYFVYASVGISFFPVGLEFSFAELPSYGTDVWIAPAASNRAKYPPFDANEFVHLPACIVNIGMSVGPGWSGSMIYFGSPIPSPGLTRYFAFMTGETNSIPGGSGSYAAGAIAGWT